MEILHFDDFWGYRKCPHGYSCSSARSVTLQRQHNSGWYLPSYKMFQNLVTGKKEYIIRFVVAVNMRACEAGFS